MSVACVGDGVPTVAHDGRSTAYGRTERDGPTLVAVHGSGGTRAVWKAQRARLPFDVAALDLAGHGDSDGVPVDAGDPLLAAYVEDVRSVVAALDADVLVGHSLGGAVVLRTLLDTEVDVAAAAVIGTGAHLPVSEQLLAWLRDDFDRFVSFMHAEDRLFHEPDDRLRHRSAALLRQVGQRVTRRDFQTCAAYDIRDRLAAISVPVLAIVGAHDGLVPPRLHQELVEDLTTGTRRVIEDAAHMAMVECPEPVNGVLTTFLVEQGGG